MEVRRRVWRPGDREIAVMNELAELAGDDGSFLARPVELTSRLDVSDQTLYRALKRLEAHGYLKRETVRTIKREPLGAMPPTRRTTRYTIVKMPTKDDEHDIGAAR